MKRKQAEALRESWGERPCDHPELAREYDRGERTGRYVCTRCGAALTFRERAELEASRTPAGQPS